MRRHGWAVVHGGLGREAEVHGIKAARAWIDGLGTAATAMTRAWASFSYFQFESQNPSLAVSSGDGDGAVWFCARRRQRPWLEVKHGLSRLGVAKIVMIELYMGRGQLLGDCKFVAGRGLSLNRQRRERQGLGSQLGSKRKSRWMRAAGEMSMVSWNRLPEVVKAGMITARWMDEAVEVSGNGLLD
ncbi:hypothetical protein M0R45_026365 [Rubus argutus]|uniref:Uncharacterized protein n=1 Tax=Rubus argutus TaxID=59490 RepID=A0AAW1WZU9_RUBAR